MSRRLALVGATLFAVVAAGRGTAIALYLPVHKDHPLVYKVMRPAQPVPKANPIHLQNPSNQSDLFKRFLEWLKTQPH
jgi:hypothetical protein